MENKNNIYQDKMCKLCEKCDTCNHDKFTEEKFYNGIVNRRCRDYKYKELNNGR